MKKIAIVCGVIAMLAVSRSAEAALAYEGFDYNAGADINGLNGGTGFSSAWADGGVLGDSLVASSGLDYSGLNTSGLALNAFSESSALIGRNLTTPFSGANGTTVWFSYLLEASSLDSTSYAIMWLRPAATSFTTYARFGVFNHPSGKQFFGIGSNTTEDYSTIPFVADTTYLVAGSITWNSSGNETLSLYINPTPGVGVPAPSFTSTAFNLTAGISRLQLKTDGSGAWTYDEIRLGDSLAAVTPVPEPSGASCLLLAIGFLMRRRNCARRS